MEPQLSKGSILNLYNNIPHPNAVVQVIGIKKLQNQAGTRYRVVLSDGVHFQQSMFMHQVTPLVDNGEIEQHSIVRILECTSNMVQNRRILVVTNAIPVSKSAGQLIGAPSNVEQVPSSAGESGGSDFGDSKPTPAAVAAAAPSPSSHNMGSGNAVHQSNNTSAPSPSSAAGVGARHSAFGQQQSSSPIVRQGGGGGGYSKPALAFQPISSITPYQPGWTIRVRVMSKTPIKTFNSRRGEGRLFSMDVCDADGEIRVTGFGTAVDRFYELIQENKVYFISRGSVKPSDRRYSTLNNEYEITIDENSLVQLCEDDKSIPGIRYNFVPIDDLGNLVANQTADVIGVVDGCSDLSEITTKAGSRLSKRVVTVFDQSKRSVEVTLWGAQAQGFAADRGQILVVKGAKVSEYNGRSLSLPSGGTTSLDPMIPESFELKGWFSEELRNSNGSISIEAFSSSSSGGGGGGGSKQTARKSFGQVRDEHLGRDKADFFLNRAFVTAVSTERTMYYTACPNRDCNKKVNQMGSEWHCEKCNRSFPECEYRYLLSFAATDHSGQQWLSAFNDTGSAVMNGVAAREVAQWKDQGQTLNLKCTVQDSLFQHFVFKVRAKEEMLPDSPGEPRLKCVVIAADPVVYKNEARVLLDEIMNLTV